MSYTSEKAGFVCNYSTIEYIHSIRQIIENSTEYNISIWRAFVDFGKAFDIVDMRAFSRVLRNARVDQRYMDNINT